MFVRRDPKTVSVTLGVGSTLLRAYAHGMCRLITIKPTNETTTYDVSIVDKYGYRFFNAYELTGEQVFAVDLPMFSYLTASLSNVSHDENFIIMLSIVENYSL